MWIHYSNLNIPYFPDKNVTQQGNYNVDLQVLYEGMRFNFEVKCPEVYPSGAFSSTVENILSVNIPFRTTGFEESKNYKAIIDKEIIKPIIANSEGKYVKYEYKKIDDNKVLTYLNSCQDKFTTSDDTSLNVLVISVLSSEMQDYWGYLYNAYSGIFTDAFREKFKKKKMVLFTRTEISTKQML